jgi:acetyl esterase/lipase
MYIKIRLVLAILLLATGVVAQDAYVTKKDINYYSDSLNNNDAYIASQCRLDFYYPKNKKDFATIVWFHGGGITGGSKELPKALMERGYAVVGVGYRLSPKVKAPAYIEGAAAAVAWVFNHIESYGGSRQLIFVSGHSAGGYLGMMTP